MNVEIERQNIILLFGNNKATQIHLWEYINRNQTLDSHRPFICSVGDPFSRQVELLVNTVSALLLPGGNSMAPRRGWSKGIAIKTSGYGLPVLSQPYPKYC
jgi:hypothetical protein